VTKGNIAELAATASVALLIGLLSVRTIGYEGKQCSGGESVSQSLLMYKLFFISARVNLRSWLPAIGPSRAPAARPKLPRHLRRLERGRRPGHIRCAGNALKTVNRLIAANDFLGLRAAVSKDYSRVQLPRVDEQGALRGRTCCFLLFVLPN
jgi:hypothetical protein